MHQLSLVWTDPKGFLMSKSKPASSLLKFEILPCFLRRRRNVQILNMSYNLMLCFRAFAETKSSCNDQNHISWKAEAQASKSRLNFSLVWLAEGEKYIQQLWQICTYKNFDTSMQYVWKIRQHLLTKWVTMIAPISVKNQIKVSAIEIMNHRWQLAVQLPLSQTTDLCRAQTSFCLQQVIGVDQEKWWGIKNFVGSGKPGGYGKPANGNYVWRSKKN